MLGLSAVPERVLPTTSRSDSAQPSRTVSPPSGLDRSAVGLALSLVTAAAVRAVAERSRKIGCDTSAPIRSRWARSGVTPTAVGATVRAVNTHINERYAVEEP